MARLIACAPTWERGGDRQLPRSGITAGNNILGDQLRQSLVSWSPPNRGVEAFPRV